MATRSRQADAQRRLHVVKRGLVVLQGLEGKPALDQSADVRRVHRQGGCAICNDEPVLSVLLVAGGAASILRWFSLAFLSRRRRGHATAARRRVRRRSGTQPTSAWTYPWLLPLFAIYQATDSGDNTLDGQRAPFAVRIVG